MARSDTKTRSETRETGQFELSPEMEPDPSEAQLWPIRFLLALEREVHIFLALVGGRTALEVMRDALQVYGNPSSRIYHLKESPGLRETLLLL